MRRNRLEPTTVVEPQLAEVTETRPAPRRWMPFNTLPDVGLDPAIWSQRVHQVALWKLLEAWNAGRRLH